MPMRVFKLVHSIVCTAIFASTYGPQTPLRRRNLFDEKRQTWILLTKHWSWTKRVSNSIRIESRFDGHSHTIQLYCFQSFCRFSVHFSSICMHLYRNQVSLFEMNRPIPNDLSPLHLFFVVFIWNCYVMSFLSTLRAIENVKLKQQINWQAARTRTEWIFISSYLVKFNVSPSGKIMLLGPMEQ